MKNITCSIILIINLCNLVEASAKDNYPLVGRDCPDFIFRNISNFNKKQFKISDFKGKWLILDFWGKGCAACVAGFPKIDAMQKTFGNQVQFILIGQQDPENKIKGMYARFRDKENLTMPCAFDSTIFNDWLVNSVPYIVIIDDKGIVQGMTSEINSSQVHDFLTGGHPFLVRSYSSGIESIKNPVVPFDDRKPYLIEGNGNLNDTDFIFRSVLSHFNQHIQKMSVPRFINLNTIDPTNRAGRFQALGSSLKALYFFAYFGRNYWNAYDTAMYGYYYNEPILEIKDSSLFKITEDYSNFYNYSLTLPLKEGSTDRLMEVMQGDIKHYFPFTSKIEIRKCPCYRLVATEEAKEKLLTAGSSDHFKEIIPRAEYIFQNVAVTRLIQAIESVVHDIVIDDTGIQQNIDIEFHSIDLQDVEKSLEFVGLKLVKSEKEMKALVIYDKH